MRVCGPVACYTAHSLGGKGNRSAGVTCCELSFTAPLAWLNHFFLLFNWVERQSNVQSLGKLGCSPRTHRTTIREARSSQGPRTHPSMCSQPQTARTDLGELGGKGRFCRRSGSAWGPHHESQHRTKRHSLAPPWEPLARSSQDGVGA